MNELTDGQRMAWKEYLSYFPSNELRGVKAVIDGIIADREEFFK